MEKKQEIRARDITAPAKRIFIDGQEYPLVFNNNAARLAENIYEDEYGRDLGYAGIMQELARQKYRAVMAVFYGAMVAGGTDIGWKAFDERFKLDSIDGIREIIAQGITQSLPEDEEEDEPKNA